MAVLNVLLLLLQFVVQYPFYVIVKEGGKIRIEGILSFVADFLYFAVNCSYTILDTYDGMGSEVSPGNWTGIIGVLYRNEADIYIGQFADEPHLFNFVDFSTAFDAITLSIMTGPPKGFLSSTPSLFGSIETKLMVVLIVSWLLMSVLYWKFYNYERKFLNDGLNPMTLVLSFITFYGLLFQRGFDYLPKSTSTRVLATGWLILVIILMTDLGGTLASKLAVMDVPERIDKIQDILKYPKIRPMIPAGLVADTHLSQATDPELQAVWNQVIEKRGIQPPPDFFQEEIRSQVAHGDALIMGPREPVLGCIASFHCNKGIQPFYIAKEPFLSLPVSFLFRKGLHPDFRERLNFRIVEHGSYGFGPLSWSLSGQYAGPCYKEAFAKQDLKALSARDLAELFKILIIGLSISTTALIAEIWSVAYKKRKEKKTETIADGLKT